MFCLLNRFSSVCIRQCYPILSEANSRSLSISRKPKHVKLADPSIHKVVYNFNYIQLTAGFFASKLYFPLGTVLVGSCASYYLNTLELVVPIIVCNAIHMTFVTVLERFLKNVVGAIFVNREGNINEVIFSTVDNWGKRIDRKHKLEEIVILDGSPLIMRAGFFLVAIADSDVRYKVNFKHAKIFDFEACKILFDDLEFLRSIKK